MLILVAQHGTKHSVAVTPYSCTPAGSILIVSQTALKQQQSRVRRMLWVWRAHSAVKNILTSRYVLLLHVLQEES